MKVEIPVSRRIIALHRTVFAVNNHSQYSAILDDEFQHGSPTSCLDRIY